MDTFQSVENYLNQSEQPFKLESYLPFSSDEDALTQMKAISSSLLTPKLLNFINDSLPQPKKAGSHHSITTLDPQLTQMITRKTRLGLQYGVLIRDVMRGLRMKIHEFIGLTRGELENAQLNLARLYINQMLPGEALYGEELVRVQNVEDTTKVEVEYKVWNSLRSKLGAAILSGVTNIWIKPGSRVLYVGNVCGIVVSELSDLVGSDGLVYVVGLSDDVIDMAGKRPNVVTIIEKRSRHWNYHMLVGLVDVIFAEIDRRLDQLHALEALFIINNAHLYLRAGGHYVISAQANDSDLGGQVKDLLAQNNDKK
ncbi:hypothetical protein POM88_054615 [Heracleum sosnowskyi]|uniref:rRNA 2'-O-methyltransferase fibrillarin n=1 Tax=Heracleum sosnowskyi TaxID=360622 RepID=A0AAD8GN73_9APIA|nr:hypothetical protein POM88_054615 [Heracleum sosnowskyi]